MAVGGMKTIKIIERGHIKRPSGKKHQSNTVYDMNGLARTLQAGDYKAPLSVVEGDRIRKLTPREYWRIMEFSDESFDKAASLVSNTRLYEQAGNSVGVKLLFYIFGAIFTDRIKLSRDRTWTKKSVVKKLFNI